MGSGKTSSKDYFDAVAPQWDGMRSGFFTTAVREKAYARAGLRAGMTVADIGAGSGFLCEGLLGRGLRIVAVDQSQRMLDVLRERLAGHGELDCRQGEAERLPLADASVDVAFANMFLHHVESPPAAIAELARILKPGGRLVLTDVNAHDHEFLRREHHDRWLGFAHADVRRWCEGAGLEAVELEDAGED
jgi:ubiquinone/menaquinone biosynthesis C-methylase UbiE